METKKHTQFGTFSVIILLPLLLLFSIMLIKSGITSSPDTYILLFLVLTFLICLLTFYQLTIIIDNSHVSFKLGIGLIQKSYKISDIKACRPVTNSVLSGIGIRMLTNGWLYNVSGFKAIELQFNNKKSVVRIGTNKPDEISSLIQNLISNELPQQPYNFDKRKQINPLMITVLITLLIPLALVISSNHDTKVTLDNKEFKINGFYGQTIPLSDLIQIDTVSFLPKIEMRTNGYAFGKTKIGNFRLSDKSHVKLYIKVGFTPYILIHSKGREPIYMNFENRQKTLKLYNDLVNNK